jgi:subfamily B ATP-binding cassette protein MsbA
MVVKAFGAEALRIAQFRDLPAAAQDQRLPHSATGDFSSPVIDVIALLMIISPAGRTPARASRRGPSARGDFLVSFLTALLLPRAAEAAGGIHNIFQQALGASQKVFEYLTTRSPSRTNRASWQVSGRALF